MSRFLNMLKWLISPHQASKKPDVSIEPPSILSQPTIGYAKGFVDPISKATIAHLKFLLHRAPMIEGPTPDHLRASRSTFAYVHPKTLAKAAAGACTIQHGAPFVKFPGSPTRWVSTTLMPEGSVIYSPDALPGLEKILRAR